MNPAEERKKRIRLPVIVEGRYDKITLSSIFDGDIFVTDGFSIFRAKEKQALLRRIAGEKGVILLTDSDGGGKQIRSFLLGILPREKVIRLYIPEIAGKEKRKRTPSKAGTLGVEGMDRKTLERIFAPFLEEGEESETFCKKSGRMITKVAFYEDKLTGFPEAKARRERLAVSLDLPHDMTANALLEAVNLLCSYEEYKVALQKMQSDAR